MSRDVAVFCSVNNGLPSEMEQERLDAFRWKLIQIGFLRQAAEFSLKKASLILEQSGLTEDF